MREELAHHLELRTRELIARGMQPSAARAEAERRLGDPAAVARTLHASGSERDRSRQVASGCQTWCWTLVSRLRQARQQPGFTLGIVLTLAIGLGATTAIFSVVHAVVLAPFPYPQPERVLVGLHHVEGRARQHLGR